MTDTRVKICGITSSEDALTAVAAGADALGFVFYAKSPRFVSPEQAAAIIDCLPLFVKTVGLFVNAGRATIEKTLAVCALDLIQLHGDETPQDCLFPGRRVIKAIRVRDAESLAQAADYEVSALLLDAWSDQVYGGSGDSFDWQLLKDFASSQPVILAGGLNPQNVAEAIRQVRPYAVDVSSGVEMSPGLKDQIKLAEFIRQVRSV